MVLLTERGEIKRKRLLEALLDSATDYAIIAMDLDGLVHRWNEGVTGSLGGPEEEMLGRTGERGLHVGDRQKGTQLAEMQSALDHGRGNDSSGGTRKGMDLLLGQREMMPLKDEMGPRKVSRKYYGTERPRSRPLKLNGLT